VAALMLYTDRSHASPSAKTSEMAITQAVTRFNCLNSMVIPAYKEKYSK